MVARRNVLAGGGLARSLAPGTWIPTNRLNSGLHAFLRSLGHASPDLEFILDMAPVLTEKAAKRVRATPFADVKLPPT